ncbi:MAG: 5-oxoprolinase subunit PxpA [Desulfarculus sp.]|nr:5-oxoprolinase subunit PxpA [Desulfarculus sp.]
MKIDLNCDMGESFGNYTLGRDAEIIGHITSANVACGCHAADPLVMDQTVRLALAHGVGIGAHPGYPDLRGFGRRRMECSAEEIRSDVLYQIGALHAIAKAAGASLQHVKPHGALYNTAMADQAVARPICQALAAYAPELILVTLAGPGGETMRRVAAQEGLTQVAQEAFADRAYTSEGRLVPRNQPGAVIHDPALVAARCLRMATEGVVEADDGTLVPLRPHTICVHGDTQGAVELARAIRAGLDKQGVAVVPLAQVL